MHHRSSSRRFASALAFVLFVGVAATTIASTTSAADATPVGTACPATNPGQLIARGSVNQIYVVNGGAAKTVTVTGPGGYSASQPTDSKGGLVLKNVPAGGPYSVSIASDATSPHSVTVLAPNQPPAPDFYTSQTMSLASIGQNPVDGYITTRDCNQLSYRIELPPGPPPVGGTKYDVVVTYSGYSPSVRPGYPWDQGIFDIFTARGYAVVGVNMRGSGCSTGAFDLMEELSWLDGYDAVETVNAQPWADNVALVGASWPGLSQLFVASTQPPHLDATVPGATVADFYRDVVYPGGIENNGFAQAWAGGRDGDNAFPSKNPSVKPITDGITDPSATPPNPPDDPVCVEHQKLRGQNVITAGPTGAFHTHPLYESADNYWKIRTADVSKITVPTILTISWQDEQVGSRPADMLKRFTPGAPVRLIGTNGIHGAYAIGRMLDLETEFLCVQLKQDCPASTVAAYNARGPVSILLETNAAGTPRTEFSMPTFQMDTGTAYTIGQAAGQQNLVPDAPDNPATPTASTFAYAPVPSAWYQMRQDVATFTSPVLTSNVVMAGTGSANLSISVPVPYNDVDLQVTLSEVRGADHAEMLVQSGWLRASQRALDPSASTALRPFQTHAATVPLTPNTFTDVRVEIFPFAHAFRAGSQIRLTVSAPGGGGNAWPWAFDAKPGGYNVTVGHGAGHISGLSLPVVTAPTVVPAAGLPPCLDTASQPCRQLLTVTRTDDLVDTNPGDGTCATAPGGCSLRAAVQEANAFPGGATIRLAAGATYPLTLNVLGSDTSAIRDLDITDATMIDGNGATIDAAQLLPDRDRVFDVRVPDLQHGAALMLVNTTIRGGSVNTDSGGGIRADGCVPIDATTNLCPRVDLIGSTVTANATSGYGGGVYTGAGAGIAVTGGTISSNTALIGGGIATAAGVSLTGATVSGNSSVWMGGGVYSPASVALTGSTFTGNTSGTSGGGVYAGGSVTSATTNFSSNTAATSGGAIYVEARLDMTNSGLMLNRATTSGVGGAVWIGSTPDALFFPTRIVGSVIAYNTAASGTNPGRGGGVRTLKKVALSWSTLGANTAAAGANIATDSATGRFDLTANAISVPQGGGANCAGTLNSLGRNIASDASCNLTTGTDLPSTDPLLGGFGDLPAGSPAVDSAGTGCPTPDLRGTVRPQHAVCDRGAIERPWP